MSLLKKEPCNVHARSSISDTRGAKIEVMRMVMRAFHVATKHGELRDFAPENKSPSSK